MIQKKAFGVFYFFFVLASTYRSCEFEATWILYAVLKVSSLLEAVSFTPHRTSGVSVSKLAWSPVCLPHSCPHPECFPFCCGCEEADPRLWWSNKCCGCFVAQFYEVSGPGRGHEPGRSAGAWRAKVGLLLQDRPSPLLSLNGCPLSTRCLCFLSPLLTVRRRCLPGYWLWLGWGLWSYLTGDFQGQTNAEERVDRSPAGWLLGV